MLHGSYTTPGIELGSMWKACCHLPVHLYFNITCFAISNYRNKHLCDILTNVFLIREMTTNDSGNSNLIIFKNGLKYVRGISRYISLSDCCW